jgi:ubiquinone/menaquinone biosynthesis C-methylase UbiE
MDLTSQDFWERFYQQNPENEWYFDQACMRQHVSRYFSRSECEDTTDRFTEHGVMLALNCGCGPVVEKLIDSKMHPKNHMIWSNFDYADSAFQANLYETSEALVLDALHLPYRSNMFDAIVEKGLFDSITSRDTGNRSARAHRLLDEYNRVLSTSGHVIIFSLFGPNGESKDMFGLLSHDFFSVECVSLYVTPAEIPDQDFCFMYVLRKKVT